MIGVDAAGARSMRYGSTGDQVDRIRVVFAQGEVADLGFRAVAGVRGRADRLERPDRPQAPAAVSDAVRPGSSGWRRPCCVIGRVMGCCDRPSEAGIQLGRLVAGSEGTLAIVLQAVLRTVPLPAAQGVVLLPFIGLSDAAAFVPELLDPALGASSCDLFDRRSISLARDADPSCRGWIDEAAEAILIVEFEGDDPDVVAGKVRLLGERADRTQGPGRRAVFNLQADRMRAAARLAPAAGAALDAVSRPGAAGLVHRRRGGPARTARDGLASGCKACSSNKTSHGPSTPTPAKAGCGCGRFSIWPIRATGPSWNRWPAGVYDIVIEAGGTISSARGCGLARTQFLRKQYGELVQVFREIKDAFDPQNQLNPGKVIGDDPHLMLRNLKPWPAVADQADRPIRRRRCFRGTGIRRARASGAAARSRPSQSGRRPATESRRDVDSGAESPSAARTAR